MKKYGKGYPYLKALLDALIEAAPNWMKAPGKFASSLSEQLQKKNQEQNKQLEKEIKSISEDKLREIIKDAGLDQKEGIEFIVEKVKLIPDILQVFDYRFDKVDEKLEQIIELLRGEKPSISFPFAPSLHNQTPPEPNFVGRKEMLETITQWYKNPKVRIGALIGSCPACRWNSYGRERFHSLSYGLLSVNISL